jgi:hypothetical protein
MTFAFILLGVKFIKVIVIKVVLEKPIDYLIGSLAPPPELSPVWGFTFSSVHEETAIERTKRTSRE